MKLVFDFDGTLHKTSLIYKSAMEESLSKLGLKPEIYYKESFIGKAPYEIRKEIGLEEKKIPGQIELTGKLMDENIKKFGKLYDGAFEVIDYLTNSYELIFCSNCRNSYKDSAREAFKLDRYFSSYITGEDNDYREKYKILREKITGPYLVIGDRENDIDAAFKNGMPSIFASYGFGRPEEGRHASYTIKDIREIMDIL